MLRDSRAKPFWLASSRTNSILSLVICEAKRAKLVLASDQWVWNRLELPEDLHNGGPIIGAQKKWEKKGRKRLKWKVSRKLLLPYKMWKWTGLQFRKAENDIGLLTTLTPKCQFNHPHLAEKNMARVVFHAWREICGFAIRNLCIHLKQLAKYSPTPFSQFALMQMIVFESRKTRGEN